MFWLIDNYEYNLKRNLSLVNILYYKQYNSILILITRDFISQMKSFMRIIVSMRAALLWERRAVKRSTLFDAKKYFTTSGRDA
jgi:hypothetical protein